jgi:hypothetical protein
VVRVDGKLPEAGMPQQSYVMAHWDGFWRQNHDNISIRGFGFAGSFPRDQHSAKPCECRGFTAPENYLAEDYDYRTDLCRAGLIVLSLPR